MVIKASGVPYAELTPEAIVVCDLDGELVEGSLAPSSDAATHGYVYRHMPEVGGIAHTHSPYATAWAARGEPIPCVLTAIADEFGGEIPVAPFALIGSDEIGREIVDDAGRATARPRCCCAATASSRSAPGPRDAVKAAVMCEDAARTVHLARTLGALEPLDAREHRRALRPLPERLWPALTRAPPRSEAASQPRPRIGLLGIMQSLYDDMLPGIAERQAAYAAELAAALGDVAERRVAPPVKEREDAERAMRDFEAPRPRRAARRDAHLRAGDARRARCSPRRGCRSASPTSSRCRRSRPRGTWPT